MGSHRKKDQYNLDPTEGLYLYEIKKEAQQINYYEVLGVENYASIDKINEPYEHLKLENICVAS